MTNDEIWDKVNRLRGDAEYQDFKYGSGTYEWELGAAITAELWNAFENIHNTEEKVLFMGIPIRINYDDRSVIKLWREVKE